MPHANPEDRRRCNAERMRRRRAAGTAWIDPVAEAERKRRWYEEMNGKARTLESTRRRRQAEREQAILEFQRKVTADEK